MHREWHPTYRREASSSAAVCSCNLPRALGKRAIGFGETTANRRGFMAGKHPVAMSLVQKGRGTCRFRGRIERPTQVLARMSPSDCAPVVREHLLVEFLHH